MPDTRTDEAGGFQQRLRVPPRERFAGGQKLVDLDEEFQRLPEQSTPSGEGHVQKALYRHGPTTTAIFAFEEGGRLRQHVLEGEAILQVLAGRVGVTAGQHDHELTPGKVLLLDPHVPHDVHAMEPTRLLMHVVLERD